MKTKLKTLFAAGAVAGLFAATAAFGQSTISPKLAPGVKPQASGYESTTTKYVVGNPTPIFSDITFTASQTGQLDKLNEPVNVLAQVKNWDWVLVGQNGEGIGYVPTDLLKPVGGAKAPAKAKKTA